MIQSPTKTVYLKDYTPPSYNLTSLHLTFDLHETQTQVQADINFERSPELTASVPLVLNGEELNLLEISIDGRVLEKGDYNLGDNLLTLFTPPEAGVLSTKVEINPTANTKLMGLYQRDGLFCTQNEAEGFRRITWYPDRPDVLTCFSVTIRGDKKKFPLLLSNGNLVDKGDLPEGRHFARWHDPFPKPSYLFALVAGDLEEVHEKYHTLSGKEVDLKIYVNHGNASRAGHAMESLKRAMKWDEETYGLEYDLDLFMIVAVDSFNMGAMENKGLNIYNSSLILADPETATDQEILMIERVVAHEYFHNWSGNRVTCRDWFQLTLKEGLTVYRDEEYISDRTTRDGIKIDVVKGLKQGQFSEDSGPLAHPVQPSSYLAIDNFYTSTVYQKGKEVIRMIETLIGKQPFKKGLKLYFKKNDGTAARVEDFLYAMEESSGKDLTHFKRWYKQAGTPHCTVTDDYDRESGQYTLNIKQTCRSTPETEHKKPFTIPVKLGLLGSEGNDKLTEEQSLLILEGEEESFSFPNINEKPIPSLFRSFSAPVTYSYDYTPENLMFLMEKDQDGFNRYDAGQRLIELCLNKANHFSFNDIFKSFSPFLSTNEKDSAFCAKNLTLPGTDYLARKRQAYPVQEIHELLREFKTGMARTYEDEFVACYFRLKTKRYSRTPEEIGRRSLKNICLSYLVCLGDDYRKLAFKQYEESDNMTDTLAALELLVNERDTMRDRALEDFFEKWKENVLVMNKWFSLQAGASCPHVLKDVWELEKHPLFDRLMPNRVRALYGRYSMNLINIHGRDGSGYRFVREKVNELDEVNPMVAASLVKSFQVCDLLDQPRQDLLKKELFFLRDKPGISQNVYDVVNRIIGQNND